MTRELTGAQVLGTATEHLLEGGYLQVVEAEDSGGVALRVFEDQYSVVGLAFFDSWYQLEEHWPASQGFLVEIMSMSLGRTEAKSWEGYLVLLTSDQPETDQRVVERIRRDTSRVRKLVATGREITGLESIAEVLLPVLPLDVAAATDGAERILDRLPDIVAAEGLDPELTQRVVSAFEQNRSPMEEIWQWRRSR